VTSADPSILTHGRERRLHPKGRTRAIGHGFVVAGYLFLGFLFVVLAPRVQSFGIDALAYWLVEVPGAYDIPHRQAGSFPYLPPAAIIGSTFSLLPLWTYLWLWTALLVGSLVWIAGSGGWIVVAFAIPVVALELYHGNIHILMAVAVLLGFRHPWTWSFILLTKFTAGVGLLWFAARGEWRSLATALGATAALCLVSFVLFPEMWPAWVDYVLTAQAIGTDEYWINLVRVPLELRMVAAVVVVVWGARTDRRWTVLVSVTLALPVLWFHGFAILVGLIAEWRRSHPEGASPTLAWRALRRLDGHGFARRPAR
jgi:hypothetical protein